MANPWERDYDDVTTAAPAAAPARSGEKTRQDQAFAYSAADAASFGLGDEAAGGVEAASAALRGEDAGAAYRKRVGEARERLRRAREDRPLTSVAGSLVGAGATFLIPGVGGVTAGGKGLQALAASRGAAGLAGQALQGARAGAIAGGIYGVASGEDTLESRARAGLQSAGAGAAFGAVTPAVIQGGGKALAAVDRAVTGGAVQRAPGAAMEVIRNRMRAARPTMGPAPGPVAPRAGAPAADAPVEATPNAYPRAGVGSRAAETTGQRGGSRPPPPPAPPAAAAAGPSDAAAHSVDKVLGRARMSPDDLERSVREAMQRPAGRVLTDIIGPEANAKTAAIAQAPGQTRTVAKEVADARARALPTRLIDEMNAGMGVGASPTQARRAIAEDFRATSQEGYAPVLRQTPTPEAMQRLAPVLQRFPERVLQSAQNTVDDIARTEGIDAATMTGAQRLHLLKMGLDDAISSMDSQEGFKAATRGALRKLKGEFLTAMEEAVPGYRQAREKWGSLHDAEEAIDAGKKAFSLRPEEVRDALDQMTPFQREHYRLSVADEAARKLMRASREVGQTNAANALNSTELQDVLREVFESPQQAAQFLDRLNEGNRLMRNASSWGAGSDSVSKAGQLADEGFSEAVEGIAGAISNPVTTGKNVVLEGARRFDAPAKERARDELGKALLTAVDDGNEEAAAFIQALLVKLRRAQQGRQDRASAAGREGAQGAISAPDDTGS